MHICYLWTIKYPQKAAWWHEPDEKVSLWEIIKTLYVLYFISYIIFLYSLFLSTPFSICIKSFLRELVFRNYDINMCLISKYAIILLKINCSNFSWCVKYNINKTFSLQKKNPKQIKGPHFIVKS